ncbi:hypothetical protein [Blattabacterium cuenoti]|uniref:hypothetical protein n=1 Tax=Blattabacterium cuenoti TaxID=1653831 RepID=UPI00311F4BC1
MIIYLYNLVHTVKKINKKNPVQQVSKNNEIKFYDIEKYHNNYFLPIPGIPDGGFLLKNLIVKIFYSTKSIFGVCLSQQAFVF